MDLLLLGPLELRSDEEPVVLGGAKQRAVLAMLALEANRSVPFERLIEGLWGEARPGNAEKRVQTYIWQLRKLLGTSGGAKILTRGRTYELRLNPDELDSRRFERLLAEAMRAAEHGQRSHAAREALDQWRGPALADLRDEPFADPEARRLEELRVAAAELAIDADLGAGRHREVMAEIDSLVAEHELREHLHAQRMLALYRCGRQSDALAAYHEARRALVGEIGVEPGPELQRLHEAILRHDASLELAPAAVELPAELERAAAVPLIGRSDELASLRELREARSGTPVLVAVTGARGIGKTRLAAELALEAHRAGDDVIYARCGDLPEGALAAVGRARGASRPTVLVADDVDLAEPELCAALAELVRRSSSLLVVATAENVSALRALRPGAGIALEPLGIEATSEIAARYGAAGAVPVDRLQAASDGIPGRIHELAGTWARGEAARRVEDSAERAQAGRSELRGVESELARNVVELRSASERAELLATGTSDDEPAVVCPYKGLASFDVGDAQYFFGRERLVAELVARMVGAPLLGVIGLSGSGKSSAVRAGLLPALAGGTLPGSDGWARVLMRPGSQPLRDLRRALARVQGDRRVVVVVDQFEETFTACADEEQRRAFIAELTDEIPRRESGGHVVVAIRADFYGRCAVYPKLSELLGANQVLVGPMRRHELRRAIELPAERVGLRVEPELVDALLADVEREPGGLPLLSTALLELWRHRDGRRLPLVTYETTGGVGGAVARLAEEAYARLDPVQQGIAQRLLVRLVGEDADGVVVRRRIAIDQLAKEQREDVAGVVEVLTDRRLLTASADTVEVAHEALLREWPRLRGWLERDAEGRRLHAHLVDAAREWDERGRDPGDLYRGSRLAAALESRSGLALSRVERDFLRASAATARRRARRMRALVIGLAALVVIAGASAVMALGNAARARSQRQLALSRGLAAVGLAHVAHDADVGALLSLEGYRRRDTVEARSAVLATLPALDRAAGALVGHTDGINTVAFSPDGRTVASGGYDRTVRLWDIRARRATGAPIREASGVTSVAFDPRGHAIAVACEDGTLHLWDVGTRRPLGPPLPGHHGPALSVAFSRHGESVASAGADGSVRVRDARTGRDLGPPLVGHSGAVRSVAFGATPARLASGGDDGTVRVWNLRTRRMVGAPLSAHRGPILGVAYSADGRWLASAGRDRTVRIWDARTHRQIGRPLTGHVGPVWGIAFSPDGRWLASAGDDNAVMLWDVARHRVSGWPLTGHTDTVEAVAFSPDGRTLASASDDKTVRLWAVGRRPLVSTLAEQPGAVEGVAVTRDGATLASAGKDGTIRLWDVSAQDDAGPALRGHRGAVTSVAFSSDDRTLASAGEDGTVRLWDVASHAAAGPALRGHRGAVASLAFSRDGRTLASAGEDGTVRLWDVIAHRETARLAAAPGERIDDVQFSPAGTVLASASADATVQLWDGSRRRALGAALRGHTGEVHAVAFSPDGQTLASASDDGTVRLWDVAQRRQLGPPLRADTDPHHAGVAFSSDGRTLASASVHHTLQLWDVATRRPLGAPLRGHTAAVEDVAFDPDGRGLVSAGQDGTVRLWDATLWSDNAKALAARVCAGVRRSLTAAEWREFIPGEPYRETCPRP